MEADRWPRYKTFQNWTTLITVALGGFNFWEPGTLIARGDKEENSRIARVYVGRIGHNSLAVVEDRERRNNGQARTVFYFGVIDGETTGTPEFHRQLDSIVRRSHRVAGRNLEQLIKDRTAELRYLP